MKFRVTARVGLNVRQGPGVHHRKVGALPYGAVVEILEERQGWGRVQRPEGWIHLGYVTPVVEAVPRGWYDEDLLDISHYQRLSEAFWATRPLGVVHKATQGTYLLDKTFGERWARLRWLDWRRGAYHFYDPDEKGLEQARVFLRVVGFQRGEIPVLDFEWGPKRLNPAQVAREVRDWLKAVEDATGTLPVIYTGKYIWDEVIGETDWAWRYPLWIAWYGEGAPQLPAGWSRWTFWQYTSKGRWPGIAGQVDRNRVSRHLVWEV